MTLPISLTSLITGTIAILAISLYLREYFLRKKGYKDEQKLFEATNQKSMQLLKAAEEAEKNVIAQGSFVTKKLISEFETKLQSIVETSQTSITSSQDQLISYMDDLKKRGEDFEEASKKSTEKRINELFERLEAKLSDFLVQTEQKTTSSIELELKATRELIETYKNQQLKLIDENIIAMMEQTLNLVLGKKLSLKDQLDLIYEALERAKMDKFIV